MIWLTGATGYLGSHLLRRLIEGNHRVRCLVLPDDRMEEALASRVEVVCGDATRFETFSGQGGGIDTIVHCAALMLPNRADRITTVNVDGTANMIRFAHDSGISRFIYVSAVSAVYASKNPYGLSKARAEQLVAEAGLDYTILRPTMIYGSGGGLHFRKLVSLIERAPGIVPILGSGAARLQPVWIEDAVTGIDLALSCPEALGKTYNLSGATVVTFNEFVDLIVAAAGIRRMKVHVPLAFCQAAAWLLARVTESSMLSPDALRGLNQDATIDYRQFEQECGYSPIPLEAGLARVFARRL
jgi:nucleoside-diphosphate-sugar epimerase